MALINCPECEARISDKAVACPHCGYPMATEHKGESMRQEFPFAEPLTQFAEVVSRTMRDVMEPIVKEARRQWCTPESESKKPEEPQKDKE
jgi:predicted amidophosphoribosyltransferase